MLSPQTLQSPAHPQGDSPASQMPLPQPQSPGHEDGDSPAWQVPLPQVEQVLVMGVWPVSQYTPAACATQ
jgi:hypothetical protein